MTRECYCIRMAYSGDVSSFEGSCDICGRSEDQIRSEAFSLQAISSNHAGTDNLQPLPAQNQLPRTEVVKKNIMACLEGITRSNEMTLETRAYVLQIAASEAQMIRLGRDVTFEYSLPGLGQRRIATQLAFANKRLVWNPVVPADPPAATDVPPLPVPYHPRLPDTEAPETLAVEPFQVHREVSLSRAAPVWDDDNMMHGWK